MADRSAGAEPVLLSEPTPNTATKGSWRPHLKRYLTVPAVVAAVAGLMVGGGVGTGVALALQTPPTKTHEYASLQRQNHKLLNENSKLSSSNSGLTRTVDQLQSVSDEYDRAKAGLASQAADLAAKQKLVDSTVTQIQANTVPGDGTYVVGTDIQPGTYRSVNNSECYWARLNDTSGSVDSIVANDNVTGQAVVTISSSDKAFESERCSQWIKIG